MNAPENISALRDFKNHDLVDDVARPGLRYEKRPATTPDGSVAARPLQRLDHARQPRTSTTRTRPTWSRA